MRLRYLRVHPSAHLQHHPIARKTRNHSSNPQADGVGNNSEEMIRLDASDVHRHMRSMLFPRKKDYPLAPLSRGKDCLNRVNAVPLGVEWLLWS